MQQTHVTGNLETQLSVITIELMLLIRIVSPDLCPELVYAYAARAFWSSQCGTRSTYASALILSPVCMNNVRGSDRREASEANDLARSVTVGDNTNSNSVTGLD